MGPKHNSPVKMAGTVEFTTKRKKFRLSVQEAREFHQAAVFEYQEIADKALTECPSQFQEQLTSLTTATDKLASSATSCLTLLTSIESSYGNKIEKLLQENERYNFMARHRDFVSQYEERVLKYMRLQPEYKAAVEAGAEQLKNKQEALELLSELANAEQEWDENVKAETLTPGNLLMRDAWNKSVEQKGLTLDEYTELRIFKDTNCCFHQSSSAKQALTELKKSLPLPDPYTRLKPTLIKLLQLLSGPQTGAA